MNNPPPALFLPPPLGSLEALVILESERIDCQSVVSCAFYVGGRI